MSESDQARRFRELVLPHLDAAYNLARWLTGNASDAEDVVQDACLRALRFMDGFHGEHARAWLLTIVRRTWFTQWHKRHGEGVGTSYDEALHGAAQRPGWADGTGTDPETLAERDDDARRVHRALALLPVDYREVLVLRELEDLSYREIAVIVDIPIGTVMSRLARGRRLLGAAVRGLEGAPSASAASAASADPLASPPSGGSRRIDIARTHRGVYK